MKEQQEATNKLIEQLTKRIRFFDHFTDHIYKSDINKYREAYEYATKNNTKK
tara:strand:- start:7926 stop:8081 length:156 start_codon:yes stop_codon:yes gene_type:complete